MHNEGLYLGKCSKSCQGEQRICKSCLMTLLRFEEISVHCGNMDISHQVCSIMGSIFQIWSEL